MLADRNQIVTEAARAQGFALAGFARLRRLEEREQFFRRWLDEGRQGTMAYLAREPERRLEPRRIDPRLKTVVSLAYPYHSPAPPAMDWRKEMRGRIAAYAFGPDYHEVVLERARAVAQVIARLYPGTASRVYADTGPVFEREWAAEARLGWFGKNTVLLNRDHGSYFFLAEILTEAEFEPTQDPCRPHCGRCVRCLDRCPTGALAQDFVIEPRLCISYLTIENRGAIARALRPRLGNWIFGCDICQEVCPWNAPFAERIAPDLAPHLPDLLALDEAAFRLRFAASAVKRAKRRGLLRNAAVALGNTGNPGGVPILARTLENEPEPLVRSHAAWALGALGGGRAKHALESARAHETDPEAAAEIESALEAL